MEKNEILREKLKVYKQDVESTRDLYERMKLIADRRLTEARNLYELERRKILSELGEAQKHYYQARERHRSFIKYHQKEL